MNIVTIILSVFVLALLSRNAQLKKSQQSNTDVVEILPPTKVVEIEIIDEMTKEKIRNLYEEQDIYNAKISHLMRQNSEYEREMKLLEERIQRNYDDMRLQLTLQPSADVRVLKANCDASNQYIYRHKLKLEGMILANAEKIVSYKKKSNAVSEQINKIGREVYDRQMM